MLTVVVINMLLLYVMMVSVILKAVTKDILKKLLARIEGKHLENANKIKYIGKN